MISKKLVRSLIYTGSFIKESNVEACKNYIERLSNKGQIFYIENEKNVWAHCS